MIPPPAQREMSARAGSTVAEAAGSHSIYVWQSACCGSAAVPARFDARREQAAGERSDSYRRERRRSRRQGVTAYGVSTTFAHPSRLCLKLS
jgi:hypothetical protein